MDEVNLVVESLKFMVLGMGVVFLFLYILIQAIKLQASLINKYFPETAPKTPSTPVANTTEDENQRIAAIIAAISEFRNKKS